MTSDVKAEIYSVSLDQTSLVNDYKIGIPLSIQYDVAKISIYSEKKLDDDEITEIAITAVSYAAYIHLGSEDSKLDGRLKKLKESKIEFQVFASVYGNSRGKNIYFPQAPRPAS